VPDSPASTLPDVTVRRVVSSFIQVTVEPLDNVTLFGSKKILLEGEEELGATVRNYVEYQIILGIGRIPQYLIDIPKKS
jgi:predicted lipid carrier protein YhbT